MTLTWLTKRKGWEASGLSIDCPCLTYPFFPYEERFLPQCFYSSHVSATTVLTSVFLQSLRQCVHTVLTSVFLQYLRQCSHTVHTSVLLQLTTFRTSRIPVYTLVRGGGQRLEGAGGLRAARHLSLLHLPPPPQGLRRRCHIIHSPLHHAGPFKTQIHKGNLILHTVRPLYRLYGAESFT